VLVLRNMFVKEASGDAFSLLEVMAGSRDCGVVVTVDKGSGHRPKARCRLSSIQTLAGVLSLVAGGVGSNTSTDDSNLDLTIFETWE
jgi:hypothetical protein